MGLIPFLSPISIVQQFRVGPERKWLSSTIWSSVSKKATRSPRTSSLFDRTERKAPTRTNLFERLSAKSWVSLPMSDEELNCSESPRISDACDSCRHDWALTSEPRES